MGEADFHFIQQLKSQSSCKIIANGGITSYRHAQEIDQNWDFDGVMIGQGAIGNPWIFTAHEPDFEEKMQVIQEHLELMIACDLWFEERGEKVENYQLHQPTLADLEKLKKEINPDLEYRAIVEFRKYLFQYIKGIPNSREWKQAMIPIKTYRGVIEKLEDLKSNF